MRSSPAAGFNLEIHACARDFRDSFCPTSDQRSAAYTPSARTRRCCAHPACLPSAMIFTGITASKALPTSAIRAVQHNCNALRGLDDDELDHQHLRPSRRGPGVAPPQSRHQIRRLGRLCSRVGRRHRGSRPAARRRPVSMPGHQDVRACRPLTAVRQGLRRMTHPRDQASSVIASAAKSMNAPTFGARIRCEG